MECSVSVISFSTKYHTDSSTGNGHGVTLTITLISKGYDTDRTKKGITMSSLGIELLTNYDTDGTKKGITMSSLEALSY